MKKKIFATVLFCIFFVCLTKTLPKNYQQEYVAVPYITYLDNTGEEITIYGEETTNVTVYNIADLAYRDPEASLSLKRYLYNNILSCKSRLRGIKKDDQRSPLTY